MANDKLMTKVIEKSKINFLDFKTKAVLFTKELDSTATDSDIVKGIAEFTDKHWDHKTPWEYQTDSSFEGYQLSESKFLEVADPMSDKDLKARVEQILKQREARSK